MKFKKYLGFSCLIMLIVMGVVSFNLRPAYAAAPSTKVFIYDSEWEGKISTANVNETFTIEVKISDVTELIGFQFSINWTTSILEVVSVAEGPFLNHSGSYISDFGPVRKPGDTGWNYNDTLYVSNSLINPSREMAATGSGVLATVTFRVKTQGISVLHFRQADDLYPFESKLMGWVQPGGGSAPKIPHTTEDGWFILPGPKIYVDPEEVLNPNLVAGASFDVNISIANVNNLYNWSLSFSWDPTVLYASEVVEGPFLKDEAPPGGTSFKQSINNTAGSISLSDKLTGAPLEGVNGTGTLATVTFLVEAKGSSELDVRDTSLYKSDESFILHVHTDGYFSNVNRDVAITSVDVEPTSVRVGESVTITVVSQNLGEMKENFDVTVYYGDSTVGSSLVSDLSPGNSSTLTVYWDTTDVVPGTYTIKARASQVHGEVNLANNVKEAASQVTVAGGGVDMTLPLVIGGVAVAATGGVAGFFLYRRRSKNLKS